MSWHKGKGRERVNMEFKTAIAPHFVKLMSPLLILFMGGGG